MPALRLVVIALIVALLPGCQAKPEAKYPQSLSACELLPREAAVRVTDVGGKLGAAQAKESHVLVPYQYCLWEYKQSREHSWSAYQAGPVERRLTMRVSVYSAKRRGAAGASGELSGQRDSLVASGTAIVQVPGLGEAAFLATDGFQGQLTTRIWFRRSNAVVTVELSGRDCCVNKTADADMQAANRRKLVLAAATTADHTLLTH
jgi:hypothetical protein